MTMVLKIHISDGSEIIVNGCDQIYFYNLIPYNEMVHSGYSWKKDYYRELMTHLMKYKFIAIVRKHSSDGMENFNPQFAFLDANSESNKPLILQTNRVIKITKIA